MVEIAQDKGFFLLKFSEQEANALGIDKNSIYELLKAKNNLWVMTETEKKAEEKKQDVKKEEPSPLEEKIIEYLAKFSLSDRVVGNFEKKLSKEEIETLKKMISEKKVEKFKLNESYKVPVYRIVTNRELLYDNKEKPIEEYTLEKDGFLVVKNELRAKQLSQELTDDIKAGKIKGTRSFTGEFYIIKTNLLDKVIDQTLAELKKEKNVCLSKIVKATSLTPTLIKIAIEFLKEEGQVMEKKMELYQYIE